MCGATETLELAIAGANVDIAQSFIDGTPMDPDADRKMDWRRTFAFHDAHLEQSPFVNSMSDIDGHQVNVPGTTPAARHVHAVQLLGEVRSGARRCSCRIIAPWSTISSA